MRVLLVGCGDIAIPLGQQLVAAGHRVSGLRRRVELLPEAFAPLAIDVSDPERCQLLRDKAFDSVVITLTPAAFNDEGYRRAYVQPLENLVPIWRQQAVPPRVYFVSSTSVYHQQEGEWVDELSPTAPSSFSGRRLLQAEQLLRDSGLPHSIIRFAGIYGPGRRRLLDKVKAGQGSVAEPPLWSNRIHRDDCVGFLLHLLQQQWAGQVLADCYIACDSAPTPIAEVEAWLAQQLGVSIGQRSASARRSGNKRCDNGRLLASGYRLRYPSFQQGYAEILAQGRK